MISHAALKKLLSYNAKTGLFRYRRRYCQKGRIGKEAGGINSCGVYLYRSIQIYKKRYLAHRLAYFYMNGEWPKALVDHRNGDTLDNRWSNLRASNKKQNGANAKLSKRNAVGYKGVSLSNAGKPYRAVIRPDGKQIYLGQFNTAEEAHAAYMRAAEKHFGAYARPA